MLQQQQQQLQWFGSGLGAAAAAAMLAGLGIATPTMLARQQRLLFDQSARCACDLARGLELPGIRAILDTSVTLELLELLGFGVGERGPPHTVTATAQKEAGTATETDTLRPGLDLDPGEDPEL
jgi:hypothetical protein